MAKPRTAKPITSRSTSLWAFQAASTPSGMARATATTRVESVSASVGSTRCAISRLIAQRVEPTLALTLSTLVVAVALAIPLGVLAAWKAHKLVDRLVMGFAVLGFAMPVFVVGYVLIFFFAVQWQLLPVQGYQPMSAGLWPFVESLILPSVALGVTYMALIARITRASMLEVLQQDYIRTANAK